MIKSLSLTVVFCATITFSPSLAMSETAAELQLKLLSGKMDACVGVANIGVDLVHERQTSEDFQLIFDDLNASFSSHPESMVARTVLFMSKLVAGHPRLGYPENVERWKSDVFVRGFDYCRDLTNF